MMIKDSLNTNCSSRLLPSPLLVGPVHHILHGDLQHTRGAGLRIQIFVEASLDVGRAWTRAELGTRGSELGRGASLDAG